MGVPRTPRSEGKALSGGQKTGSRLPKNASRSAEPPVRHMTVLRPYCDDEDADLSSGDDSGSLEHSDNENDEPHPEPRSQPGPASARQPRQRPPAARRSQRRGAGSASNSEDAGDNGGGGGEEEEGTSGDEGPSSDGDDDGDGEVGKGGAAGDAGEPSSSGASEGEGDDAAAGRGQNGAAAAAGGGAQRRRRRGGGGDKEALAAGLEALAADERAAVLADAPELAALLRGMTAAMGEVSARVAPMLAEVRSGGLDTAGGLSYLDAKSLLLLEYCAALVALVALRAEGRPVEGHPVVTRLVQLRAFIERTRPIDKRLAYQLDKLLRTAGGATGADAAGGGPAVGGGRGGGGGGGGEALPTTDELHPWDGDYGAAAARRPGAAGGGGGVDDDDALRYRPNPAALVAKAPLAGAGAGGFAEGGGAGAGGGGGGVYRPPRLNPVAMEEDMRVSRQERRRQAELRRRAQRSDLIRDLARELAGAPEEAESILPGLDSAAAAASRRRLEARAAQEEELMMRVPLPRAEVKRLKAQRRAGLAGQGLLEDFEAEVADLVGGAAAGGGARRRGVAAPGRGGGGGDGAEVGGGSGGGPKRHGGGGGGGGSGEGDELFAASKAARAAAKGQKRRRHG